MSIRLLEPAQAEWDETISWYAQQALRLGDAQEAQDMAETANALHRPFMPSPKAFQKALTRLADTFGHKVPVNTPRTTAAKPKQKT